MKYKFRNKTPCRIFLNFIATYKINIKEFNNTKRLNIIENSILPPKNYLKFTFSH